MSILESILKRTKNEGLLEKLSGLKQKLKGAQQGDLIPELAMHEAMERGRAGNKIASQLSVQTQRKELLDKLMNLDKLNQDELRAITGGPKGQRK